MQAVKVRHFCLHLEVFHLALELLEPLLQTPALLYVFNSDEQNKKAFSVKLVF